MSGLTIITDLSAYLPENLTQELGIEVVPLQVIWSGESYYDGVDIKATEFYTRLKTAADLPTTSAVSVHQFQSKIDDLLSKDRSA